jgi:hypothetical protein
VSWLLFAQILALLVVITILVFTLIEHWHDKAVEADTKRRKEWS